VITNHYDIQEAKKKADYVIVIAHGGREHYQLPTPQQRERFRFFVDSGADIVVGHHSHCYSGFEKYNGKPIFYSLGNFIFDYKKKYRKGLWTQGYAVMFKIENDIVDFELIPYHQGREENPNLVLLDVNERIVFDNEINQFNTIIVNDNLFKEEWSKYVDSQRKSYKGLLLTQNKYIRALMVKGLLPGFFFHSRGHQNVLLNLLKCETHREIMIDVIDKQLP
jgi:poly-gamma-glutamate synthesis protein (capsule biosynthesis protein)